jgi:hypothetical protein
VEDRRRRVLAAPWTDEIASIMQKAMDRGEVKVYCRTPGTLGGQGTDPHGGLTNITEKPVVFEVFDEQGNITDVGPWYRRDRHEHYAKGSRVKAPGEKRSILQLI